MSKLELIDKKMEKTKEKLSQREAQVKTLKAELAALEKERQEAELHELTAYMKEFKLTPIEAKAILQERIRKGQEDEQKESW